MLLYLRPRMLSCYESELLDFEIKPIGLKLIGGKDLMTKQPYPNKRYWVACRKQGRKAMDGLLIEIEKPMKQFTTICNWMIDPGRGRFYTATHEVHFQLLDFELDAVSDSLGDWYGMYNTPFENRAPSELKEASPCHVDPKMEWPLSSGSEVGDVTDYLSDDENPTLTRRVHRLCLPTIERQRLFYPGWLEERMPREESAFLVGSEQPQ